MKENERAQKELKKKLERRKEEKRQIEKEHGKFVLSLFSPASPKKPTEYCFDKKDEMSFKFPISIGNTIYEIKRDGFGVEIIVGEEVKIYSLDGNLWNIDCFPEIKPDLLALPPGYYKGELFGFNYDNRERFTSLDEFVAVQKRPKINPEAVTSELLDKYPLRIELFDILRLWQSSLLLESLSKRRGILEKIIKQTTNLGLVPQWTITNERELHKLYLYALENEYEGLVGKDPDSYYIPGSRDSDWIKLKNFTTLDLAVLGFYQTEASISAGKPISAVLVGSYNKAAKKFESIAKIKIGKKTIAEEIYEMAKNRQKVNGNADKELELNDEISFNPVITKVEKKVPFEIIDYKKMDKVIVLEIQILNVTFSENWHSCGLDNGFAHSLRIPTFVRVRFDKTKKEEVTSTEEIQQLYFGEVPSQISCEEN